MFDNFFQVMLAEHGDMMVFPLTFMVDLTN